MLKKFIFLIPLLASPSIAAGIYIGSSGCGGTCAASSITNLTVSTITVPSELAFIFQSTSTTIPQVFISSDGRMGIGGRVDQTSNLATMLQVQSTTTPQGSGSGNQYGAVDIVALNYGTSGSRLQAFSGLSTGYIPVVTYLNASGPGDTGAWWVGGPRKDSENQMQFQNGFNTMFDFFSSTSTTKNSDVYFWIENSTGAFHWNVGAAGAESFSVNTVGPIATSGTLAALQALTTVPGNFFYCSNCVTDAMCVSTGTIHSLVRTSARSTACQ